MKVSLIIDILTKIKDHHGDIHVRVMGEPLSGISVREHRFIYADHVESHFEANIVGISFNGFLKHAAENYDKLPPIKEVADLVKKAEGK